MTTTIIAVNKKSLANPFKFLTHSWELVGGESGVLLVTSSDKGQTRHFVCVCVCVGLCVCVREAMLWRAVDGSHGPKESLANISTPAEGS